MTKAKTFMNSFMEKLNTNGFNKDNHSNGFTELTNEFIDKQIELYTTLVKSEIFNFVAK